MDGDDQVSLNVPLRAFLTLPIPATPHARTLGAIAMIKWFTNRKRRKETIRLEGLLVDQLSLLQPNMSDIYKQAKLSTIVPVTTPQPFIQLLHTINGPYLEKNRKKHKDFYILTGIEIKKRDTDEFVEVPIEVTWDLVSRIIIDRPSDFWKYYAIETIRVNNLIRTELPVSNEDEEKLKKILKTVDPEQIKKLEIEDTFEIELNETKFYTILNMEDGNYIAINNKRQVYRLNHDSNEQVRLIDKSVDNFLKQFSGDKKELEKHFES